LVYNNFPTPPTATIKTIKVDGNTATTVVTTGDALSFLSWGIPTTQSGGSTGGSTTPTPTPAPTNNVVPGVTVTDPKVYTEAPKQVASSSAVAVMTPQETKTQTIVSNTPDVCLPNKDDIVFIDEGRCSASILDKKTGEVLRRFRTTVVEDEVSELKIGNEVAILAPIYFDGGSTEVNDKGMKRIRGRKSKITAAGSVLVVGHSGIALGDTEENRILSKERATSTVAAMKKVGSKGPFFATGIGGKDPQTTSTSGKDQDKNRRVVIILVP
jgi:outer membrane protein OmpA-like peptidoglycan-associated protein